MTTLLDNHLYHSAGHIFEDLGFLLPNLELEESQVHLPAEASVCVAFEGPFCGALVITVHGEMLNALASNMLGEDDVSDRQRMDALGEIGNVVCGNLLPRIGGSRVVFRLQAPRLTRGPEAETPSGEMMGQSQLGFDEGWAELQLFVSQGSDHLAPAPDPSEEDL
jgi:CheY-specific phosphatase CheX